MVIRLALAVFIASMFVGLIGCADTAAEEQPAETEQSERQDPPGMEGAFDIDK